MNTLSNEYSKIIKKSINNKYRKCMYRNCQNFAINSHVLQKNGILKEISEKNHIIEHSNLNIFKQENNNISDFKKVGINKAYIFYGFCNQHDTAIFKPIEIASEIEFNLPLQQGLFCYRGLCQEIRRKEIAIELVDQLPTKNILFKIIKKFHIRKFRKGYRNLFYFKTELEICLEKDDFSKFHFETIEIPKIDLCISVPLNIEDKRNRKSSDRKIPFVTSFINIFPKGENSYIIIGYHKDYPCFWTDNFVNKIKNGSQSIILKELSNLIVLRLEFWAISISLFESLDKNDIETMKNLSIENVFDHSKELETDLNLFRHLIK